MLINDDFIAEISVANFAVMMWFKNVLFALVMVIVSAVR
jgi:hypothetical protein